MMLHRGDLALAHYPFASRIGSSRRPVLILQSDIYIRRICNTIVAQITTNLARGNDPAHLLIEISTPDGKQTGLLHDSVVSCLNLATLTDDRIDQVIGRLSDVLMGEINARLKVALALP